MPHQVTLIAPRLVKKMSAHKVLILNRKLEFSTLMALTIGNGSLVGSAFEGIERGLVDGVCASRRAIISMRIVAKYSENTVTIESKKKRVCAPR